ncbi:hypothetical protein FB567DRAFT_627637 [Paraphoma chrysanthemicola]|uniref:Uncharacterized protein n=1 Tax=Paraphoma chrysanthemicola TaxID=798071 RepID=A0A8K0W0E5_9PLEO|nr:hypothetical protein FB567DRAFT_627637 [Paraphoma chrysanthemicola]
MYNVLHRPPTSNARRSSAREGSEQQRQQSDGPTPSNQDGAEVQEPQEQRIHPADRLRRAGLISQQPRPSSSRDDKTFRRQARRARREREAHQLRQTSGILQSANTHQMHPMPGIYGASTPLTSQIQHNYYGPQQPLPVNGLQIAPYHPGTFVQSRMDWEYSPAMVEGGAHSVGHSQGQEEVQGNANGTLDEQVDRFLDELKAELGAKWAKNDAA